MKEKTVDLGKKGSFKVKPGAFHRNMGVPAGKPITQEVIKRGENSSSPTVRHEAASAAGFKAMNHKKHGSPFGKKSDPPPAAPPASGSGGMTQMGTAQSPPNAPAMQSAAPEGASMPMKKKKFPSPFGKR